ncbi:hypothetical protein AY547_06915 [Corynebacterium diphtheriae bv. gravis]|nr:hypothetical protein BUE68_08380 [Corynebacterium diphtheriae]OWN54448.1 hypothetical protein AY500_10485 [Corynebacterium diphtheriae bv. gravis]OWN76539.1 hypothetical protein AY508_08350 [Corynebacterium diphtheriae bv. gravis]OWO37661.1 hypothetical protein AY547_06915 [Corynebacterium diphtheriae bv. gravis]
MQFELGHCGYPALSYRKVNIGFRKPKALRGLSQAGVHFPWGKVDAQRAPRQRQELLFANYAKLTNN